LPFDTSLPESAVCPKSFELSVLPVDFAFQLPLRVKT
jgi:hypothetical protein